MKTHISPISKMLQLVLVMLILASCKSTSTNKEVQENTVAENEVKLSAEQMKNAGIALGEIQLKPMSHTIIANGVLDVPPHSRISVSAPIGGFIKQLNLMPGMQIRKGQILAVLQHPDYIQMQQEYLEAKSQLTYATAEYERQKLLGKDNISAGKTVQQSAADFNVLQAKVNALTQKLLLLNINLNELNKGKISGSINLYSPINGYVTSVNVNTGKYCTPQEVLFELVNVDEMHAQITLFEKDLPMVREGQNVNILIPGSDKKIAAKLKLIGKNVEADKTIQLHAHILNSTAGLVPGMYVKAEIETESSNVFTVPDKAIASARNINYLFVAKGNNTFEKMQVETGNSANGFTEVKLTQQQKQEITGKKIAVNGAYALISQMLNSAEE